MRAVLFQDGEAWLAHCLEQNICAQASTIEEAYNRLGLTISAERDYSRERKMPDFHGIGPAPARIFLLYSKAPGTYQPETSNTDLCVRVAMSD